MRALHFIKSGSIILFLITLLGLNTASALTDQEQRNLRMSRESRSQDWHVGLNASWSRGLDEYSDPFFTYNIWGTYKLAPQKNLGASFNYSHPYDNKATFPEDWGIGDLSLFYNEAQKWQWSKKSHTSVRLRLVLPLSERSRLAGLNAQVAALFPTSFQQGAWRYTASIGLVLASHRYETANVSGSVRNYWGSLPLSFLISKTFLDHLSVAASASFSGKLDYEGYFVSTQNLGLNFAYNIRSYSLSLGYVWGDRFLSNYSFLDDDRARYYVSLGYTF